LHVLVEEQAKEWYWMYVRSTEKQEWTYLRYALQKQFQSHRSNFEQEAEARRNRRGVYLDHASSQISTRDAVFRLRPDKVNKDEY